MKQIISPLALALALALAGCGSEPDSNGDSSAGAPKGNFTITSPVEFSEDPAVRQTQQKNIVDSMLADPSVPLEAIEGEAARRGVTLTEEQRSAKRAQKHDAAAPAKETPVG